MNQGLAAEIAGKIEAGARFLCGEFGAGMSKDELMLLAVSMLREASDNIRLIGGLCTEDVECAAEEFMPDVLARYGNRSCCRGCHAN